MRNQQLLDYIKQQLQQGTNKEQIKNSLIANGWQEQDINEGLNAINSSTQLNQNSNLPTKAPTKIWKIFVVSLIGLVIIGGGVYFTIQKFSKSENKPGLSDKQAVQSPTPSYNLETAKIATIPEKYKSVSPQNIVFSRDIKRVAYSIEKEGKQIAVVDDKESKSYDNMQILGFTSDGKDIVLRARAGEKWFMVIDNQEGKKYDSVDMQFLEINNGNGNSIIYKAKDAGKEFIVNNGQESKKYDEITCLGTEPIAKKVFFTAKEGGQVFFVIDNQETKYNYDNYNYNCLKFSADGERSFYTAFQDKDRFLVINKVEGKRYEYLSNPRFSPDGQKLIYKAAKVMGGKQFMVINSEELKGYDTIQDFTVSLDSQKIAYSVVDHNSSPTKYFVVNGNQEGKRYDNAGNLAFSPDSNKLVYIAKEGNKEFIVVNGQEGEKYDSVGIFAFSPDSQKISYLAKDGDRFSIVTNEEKGLLYDFIFGLPSFSLDSQNIIYLVKSENKYSVVMNEQKGNNYDFIWPGVFGFEMQEYGNTSIIRTMFFTKDGKNIVYGAKLGNELWRIVELVK